MPCTNIMNICISVKLHSKTGHDSTTVTGQLL